MKLYFTTKAKNQLEDIYRFYEAQSEKVAIDIYNKILDGVASQYLSIPWTLHRTDTSMKGERGILSCCWRGGLLLRFL